MDKNVIAKEIKNLYTKKAIPQGDFPAKILKLNIIYILNICTRFLTKVLKRPIFQTNQNMEISPQFIKNRREKENYRPVSIITVTSNILGRCLCDQIYLNIDNTLSRNHGLLKGIQFSTFIDCDVRKMEEKSKLRGEMQCFICKFI